MADANPTPKHLRFCYTCEHYQGGPVGELEVPPGFESDPSWSDDWIADLEPMTAQCLRFPPVFTPDKDYSDDDLRGHIAESANSWNQPIVLGCFTCGEWRLREGLKINSVSRSAQEQNVVWGIPRRSAGRGHEFRTVVHAYTNSDLGGRLIYRPYAFVNGKPEESDFGFVRLCNGQAAMHGVSSARTTTKRCERCDTKIKKFGIVATDAPDE